MEELEASKKEVTAYRERQWRDDWQRRYAKEHKLVYERGRDLDKIPPAPAPPDLSPKGWASVQWATGHLVMDQEAFMKLPKAKQAKIIKLGGL